MLLMLYCIVIASGCRLFLQCFPVIQRHAGQVNGRLKLPTGMKVSVCLSGILMGTCQGCLSTNFKPVHW